MESTSQGPKAKKKKMPTVERTKEHRIMIRWLHFDEEKGQYLPVRQKNGGGNRFIKYLSSDPPTLPDILERASELYFRGGKNKFAGDFNNLSTVIADSTGEQIEEFPGEGTVTNYLSHNGLCPSGTYLCLRSKRLDSSSNLPSNSPSTSEQSLYEPPEMPHYFMEEVEENAHTSTNLSEVTEVGSESAPPPTVLNIPADNQPHQIPESPSEVFKVLKVRRSFIQKDMIEHFKHDSYMNAQLTFSITNDMGKDELGAGIGVTQEVFTLFWKSFANSMTIGERERVPIVRHDLYIDEWEAVARILVKGYKMISYFPTFMSKTFMCYCLFGRDVPNSTVLESFMKYLSPSEEELIKECLKEEFALDNIVDKDELLDFLERFNCQTVVKNENIKTIITEIALQELIQKPHLMVATWQPAIQMLKEYPPFQTLAALEDFHKSMKPTTKKILQLLDGQPTSDVWRDAFRFLQ